MLSFYVFFILLLSVLNTAYFLTTCMLIKLVIVIRHAKRLVVYFLLQTC
ncbi:hypothetical protein C3B55_00043 [Candidatus Pseudomonas adelgestsugas]|uniref:Uncharacterized protein n=1 Tax=Candidatus Pseudomonas adelgestsugas TaxID=1302376 RepID=A0ABX5R7V7_9PSED|nr:hypothetical protein C3B55_00043 [Candidatus Pseudomonas adelgestsugas]